MFPENSKLMAEMLWAQNCGNKPDKDKLVGAIAKLLDDQRKMYESKLSDMTQIEKAKICMQKNPEASWSWHCNLVETMLTYGVSRWSANMSSGYFLFHAFGVDVREFPEWDHERICQDQ